MVLIVLIYVFFLFAMIQAITENGVRVVRDGTFWVMIFAFGTLVFCTFKDFLV